MKRSLWLGLTVIGFVVGPAGLAPAAPTRASDSAKGSPLAVVPAQAAIVVHLKGVEGTKDRLVALAKNAVPDLLPMLEKKYDEMMQEATKERKIQGLAKDGPIFVVFTTLPGPGQDMPNVAVVAKVTNFREFVDGLLKEDERKSLKKESDAGYESATVDNRETFFLEKNGFAVVTPVKDVATQFAKKQAGLDAELNPDIAQKLLMSDAGVYVDMAAVNKEFGPQIQTGRQFLDIILQNAGGQLDKSQLEMVKGVFDGIFQLVEDMRGFLLTGELRPEGFALHTQVVVGADSKSNGILKAGHPATLGQVDKMPAGAMVYASMAYDEGLFKAFQPFISNILGGPQGKENEKLQEAIKEDIKAGPQSFATSFSLPVAGIQAWTYKDPQQAAASALKMMQALKEGETFGNLALKEKPTVKENDQDHRGFKLSSVVMKFDWDKVAESTPQGGKEMAEMMKKMMGDSRNWFGTDGKQYVRLTAKDWAEAQKLLDEYLDGKNQIGKEKPFEEARKQAPAKATLQAYIDAPRYVATVAGMIGPMFKAQGLPIEIPEMKADKGKAFMAVSVTVQPERGSFDFWLPGTAIAEFKKMVPPPAQ